MTKDEALKLALEALVLNNAEWKHLADSGDSGDWSAEDQDHYKQTEEAITAIKEALAQPEQEPVATDWERIARVQNAKLMAVCDEAGGFEKLCEVMDKYERTTPPQRTWVGLTDEEIQYCVELKNSEAIAEEVEAKLKEKNT